MMRLIPIALSLVLASSAALAQTDAKPANNDANTPAVATPDTKNPNAPVAGANSFTEDQARKRITEVGYTDVTGLVKDEKGVWRGKASKGGSSMDVSLDFQGNVTSK